VGEAGRGNLPHDGDGQAAGLDHQRLERFMLDRPQLQAVRASHAEVAQTRIGEQDRRDVRLVQPGRVAVLTRDIAQVAIRPRPSDVLPPTG
jgi:hypothetical protein